MASQPCLVPMSLFRPPASFDELTQRHGERYKWLVLIIAGLGVVSGVLASTSFSVAIPAIMKQFSVGQEQVQWTMTGFLAAMTVGMLPTPWLLQRLGFRRVFLGALCLLGLSGLIGNFASSFVLVVGLRIVQGIAAGVVYPLGTIAVMRLFPAHQQGRASGLMGFGIVLAPAMAPTLGGMLLDHFGWASIFLISVPTSLLAIVAGVGLLPRAKVEDRKSFDWLGVSLLTVSSLAIVESVASFQHSGMLATRTLIFLATAILTLLGFIAHSSRAQHPIIHIGLFRNRTFSMGTLVGFVYGFGLYASAYVIPVFLQQAMQYSATDAGIALLPSGIVLALVILIAGKMADVYSPLMITIAGLVIFVLSFVFLGVVSGTVTYAEIIAATILGRIGLGLIVPALSLATLRHLDPKSLGQSAVVVSYVRQLGGVLGVAVTAVVLAWREAAYQGTHTGLVRAYGEVFFLIAAVFLLAVVAACFMKSK